MNWKDTLRMMVEETIHCLEEENKDEENLDSVFPTCESAGIDIDGAEHEMKIYFVLDDKLPEYLQYTS